MKKVFNYLGMAVLGGAFTLVGYKFMFGNQEVVVKTSTQPLQTVTANYNPVLTRALAAEGTVDFTVAAENSIHAVVHVKNTAVKTQTSPLDIFFGRSNGERKYEQVGTGSGVIISADGYIVTNNHVIDDATEIEITLNNQKKYKAELIGSDASNDIALLKIEADIELPYVPFANSDTVKVGEWVLAVGNPYNLTSTVTAGIVSAKGRDLEGNRNIESFIQTDAAVNPGNSGGALVNTRGELVGINTAISSKTGSFIGYSFAVPSNIARKIIDDILEFGKVQQAVLGINVDLSYNEGGVKVAAVLEETKKAKVAGLKTGDIIMKIDEVTISKFSELKGQLTAKRPGDFVNVTVDRDGETKIVKVQLSKTIERFVSNVFQWELKDLTKEEIKKRAVKQGVKIIRTGKDEDDSSLKNYIITKVNDTLVNDAKETVALLDNLGTNRYRVTIEMINLDGETERYIYR